MPTTLPLRLEQNRGLETNAARFRESVTTEPLAAPESTQWDDFSRNVYCVLGIPIDVVDMPSLVRAVEKAAVARLPFMISTVNLNYLVTSQSDFAFRETLLQSELCPADGMPLVWIARLMGIPIEGRVAGSDMLEALTARAPFALRLKLFLFGGAKGIAEAAAKALNNAPGGLCCVGAIDPGFGSIADMSQDRIIDEINASGAEFLVVALGAKKGQLWLQRNHDRLCVPIRAHLGATINFIAGRVRRAPPVVRRLGLEWLWRIKEEPYLWRRYWHDGRYFLELLFTRVLPLALWERWRRLRADAGQDLMIEGQHNPDGTTLSLSGAATARNVEKAAAIFRHLVSTNQKIRINLSNTCIIDARFLGLLLMLRKQAKKRSAEVEFTDVPSRLQRMFRCNGVGFLLSAGSD